MATAEIAVALPSLVLVTAIALWGLTLASVQLTCTDAARAGARAAARGEPLDAVRALVLKAVPKEATVKVSRNETTVHVDVAAPVKPPSAAGLPSLTVHAHVAAETEPGAVPTDAEPPSPPPPQTPPNHPTKPASRTRPQDDAAPTRHARPPAGGRNLPDEHRNTAHEESDRGRQNRWSAATTLTNYDGGDDMQQGPAHQKGC